MRKTVLLIFVFLSLGCAGSAPRPASTEAPVDPFAGAQGCFLLYDLKNDKFEKIVNEENCRERLPACSTFKVPLAVIAFEEGVLKDENTILKWDGKKDARPEVNRDHDAKSWMSESVVWFSQHLTPKIGESRMKKYLSDFQYGNQDLSEGLTRAWLVSPAEKDKGLRISGFEQVEFMKKLWNEDLPVSKRSQRLARELTFLETSPSGALLHGKTGSNYYDSERKVRLGWFVAHVEKDDREFIAVTRFSDTLPTDEPLYGGAKAKQITKKILESSGLW